VGKKLYVGNIPFTTTEDEIKGLFEPCGTVATATIITDRETGRSRGFCFVEMGDDAQAADAISKLNNTDFGGRKLVVNEAREREKGSRGNSFNGGDRGNYRDDRGGRQFNSRRGGGDTNYSDRRDFR
jgi:cold-inducible RNA-binding protein